MNRIVTTLRRWRPKRYTVEDIEEMCRYYKVVTIRQYPQWGKHFERWEIDVKLQELDGMVVTYHGFTLSETLGKIAGDS